MKQRILVCLALALLLALGLTTTAMAANVPEINMALSETRLSGPQEITVTISVTNKSDSASIGPMALYDPNDAQIHEFGTPTLTPGETHSWNGAWTVTEEQLKLGRIVYTLVYYSTDESGVLRTDRASFYKEIIDIGTEPELKVSRTITPATARKNQTVTVTYVIENVGSVEVKDLAIKENSGTADLGALRVGALTSHTFTLTMGSKDQKSAAEITYTANDQPYTMKVEEQTIKYGEVNLNASVKADKKGGPVGETVKLTLTLKNTGNSDFQNITVTDAVLGEVFSGVTVEAKKEQELFTDLIVSGDQTVRFIVSAVTADGTAVQTATEPLKVIAVDPALKPDLSVSSTASGTAFLTFPSVVKFTVTVTNNNTVPVENVRVVSNGVTFKTYASIPAGQSVTFTRDVELSMAGAYRFDAVTNDQLGDPMPPFMGNEVRIIQARPAATPTQVPISTPVRPNLLNTPSMADIPSDWQDSVKPMLDVAKWVFMGLGGVCLTLVVIGFAGRSAKAARSGNATDHLQRDGYSVYTEAVPQRKRRIVTDNSIEETTKKRGKRKSPEPMAEPVQEMAEEAPDMQEAMNELYPEADIAQEQPAQAPYEAEGYQEQPIYDEPVYDEPVYQEQPVYDEPAEETTYRRRRRNNTEE